ncbi:MAG: putative rane protein involved in D-alanine export [Gemmataceae bacterium]|nr:putative rane protein involved in D-alanine export [Gemmataceae bacterium]
MLFHTIKFVWFFLIVFSAYWLTPWRQVRVAILLAASFYFYASWNKWLALIVLGSSLTDYLIARGLESSTSWSWRRFFLGVSVVGNLGLLCYFKYANFFLRSLEEALSAAGGTASLPVLSVMLPIGISFYTFEAISYTVDVYRRRIPAERNPLHFLLFITFFPHLVAGPIVRARDFLPQIRKRKRWNWGRVHLGVQYFLLGLCKKMVIADRMAMYSDPVFAAPDQFGTGAVWLAMLAYALQIYCDFSGYTDMALGTAHMLGYKLATNFNLPYLAANVSDFWRRWHISLSTWLRDYVYIPLGGNRNSENPHRNNLLTARNLLITMALGGLWHGAAWTFVIWGILHGSFLIVHRTFRSWSERHPRLDRALKTLPGTLLRVCTTFLCVCVAWVFFRAQTLTGAVAFVRRLFTWQVGAPAELTYHCLATLGAVVLVAHVLMYHGFWKRAVDRLPAPVLGLSYAVLATLALTLTPETAKVFIYFQF